MDFLVVMVFLLLAKKNWMKNHNQGPRNSIISGEAAQVKERSKAGNFKKLL